MRDTGPVRRERINEMIRLSPIRLVDQDNNQVGVVETYDALRMAREAGLDLVEVQPDVRPPVCKIMDYGKYKFELSKKERGQRAASKQAEMKEVRLGRSQKIDDHDVGIRMEQARRFLMDGHKVQFVQRFRGREITHKDTAFSRFNRVVEQLSDISKVEVPPRQFGPRMTMILAPEKNKIETIKRRQEKERQAKAGPKSQAQPSKAADAKPTSAKPTSAEPTSAEPTSPGPKGDRAADPAPEAVESRT